ncbi:MAG: UDP-3-O-(3-hydroxymyristoyl)glucosamine N-acyltransferase [Rhizobiaceae bacterium]|nr:UDP-3-O-(3-hydroxymyristoyl)glucosamine N-acyltransferase [Rhizobiaceae bacterium]
MSDPVFFVPARRFTVAEIAELVGASVAGSGDVVIDGIASLSDAAPGKIAFAEGKANAKHLPGLQAGALLCTAELAQHAPAGISVLVTPAPQRSFALIGRLLFPEAAAPVAMTGETGISERAHIAASARLEPGVIVEAGAVVGPGVAIGAGTIVAPNAVVGRECRIGRDCYIGPGSTVQYALLGNRVIIHAGARIGQDGFGFVFGRSGPERMPQVGRVVIQDNVEVGANSTVDRGALTDTVIGENTKIDNLVQVAHNVRIGRNCVVAGLSGISGSVKIGDNVMVAGGVGLADHLTVGDGARLAARSGFMHDVPAGEVWAGYPAKPIGQAMREIATLSKLAKHKPKGGKGDE